MALCQFSARCSSRDRFGIARAMDLFLDGKFGGSLFSRRFGSRFPRAFRSGGLSFCRRNLSFGECSNFCSLSALWLDVVGSRQNIERDRPCVMDGAHHAKAQWAMALQHLGSVKPRTDDSAEIRRQQIEFFHVRLEIVDWVRRADRPVLLLVVIDKDEQNSERVIFRRAFGGTPQGLGG